MRGLSDRVDIMLTVMKIMIVVMIIIKCTLTQLLRREKSFPSISLPFRFYLIIII